MKRLASITMAASLLVFTGSANAVTITGTLNGLPLNASVDFSVARANEVQVILSNLQPNPTSAIQLISGVRFDVTDADGSPLSVLSQSGTLINIAPGGIVSSVTGQPDRWNASWTGTSVLLTTLGNGNPAQLVIGAPNASGLYASANDSITGNGDKNTGDNPSISETATFIIHVSGVTPTSTFSNPVILFGTDGQTPGTSVPDSGSTLALLGMALAGGELLRRRFLKA